MTKSCCVPSVATAPGTAADAAGGTGATASPAGRDARRAVIASLVQLPGGTFTMGSNAADVVTEDGEGPARRVAIERFAIAPATVTNREFAVFVRATRYVTDAERLGTSFVFYLQLPEAARRSARQVAPGLPWWLPVDYACWQRPEGAGSHVRDRDDHPVVHVSWNDCAAYCGWSGTRLPTEAQWEYAARGGLDGRRFAWGDDLLRDGAPRCNVWRGGFPDAPAPGWSPGPMPASALEPNGFGLFHACGNVWEWCADWFSATYHTDTAATDPRGERPTGRRSLRGGSFLCHDSYCNRYRVSARSSNTPDSAASNIGFRVVG